MLKMNPTFIEENGKARFVVFSMKEFKAITEALEDAHDIHLIEESKRRSAGKPGVSHEQILNEVGLKPTRRKSGRQFKDSRPL